MMVYDYNIGDYEVNVDDDALLAEVRHLPTGKVVSRHRGESAWADARRKAQDLYFAQQHA